MFAQDSLLLFPQSTILYQDCANIFLLKNRIETQKLQIECEDCEWKKNEKNPLKLCIIPREKSADARIKVWNGDTLIAEKKFKIVYPPKPKEIWTSSGKIIQNDDNRLIARGMKLVFQVQADSLFVLQCPFDMHYKIDKIELFAQKGSNSPELILSQDCSKLYSEERISLYIPETIDKYTGGLFIQETQNLYRKNYKGDWIKDNRLLWCDKHSALRIK